MERREFLKKVAFASSIYGLTSDLKLFAHEDHAIEKLVILHTNDVHSHIDPFTSGEYAGMGGVAARKILIDDVRSKEKNVLLLDSGDIFQGTPYFNMFLGEVEFKAMSMMGYDAATMGNHDFDGGIDNFKDQLKHANFPFIVSNYDFSDTVLNGQTLPYKIIKKGKLKIGLLGLGIELDGLVDKKMYKETRYLDPLSMANKTASFLKNEMGCHLVIALSHLGYAYESKSKISDIYLGQLSENIDIILGGHTHTFLNKPKLVKNKKNKLVVINQVGWGGVNLGKLNVYFDLNMNNFVLDSSHVIEVTKKN
jgi:5'-nucleotidase